MDKKYAHIELSKESETRIRDAIRHADLESLRKDPYYAMQDAPELAEIGMSEPAAGRKVSAAGRKVTPILRLIPLVAAAAILLMIAVPRLLSTGQEGEVTPIEQSDDGTAYMEGNEDPSATGPLIVDQTVSAGEAVESLQAFYGEDYRVEVTAEADGQATLTIMKEGEDDLIAVIDLETGAVTVKNADGEIVSEGTVSSGIYTEK